MGMSDMMGPLVAVLLLAACVAQVTAVAVCKDSDYMCPEWESWGECESNPIWMGQNCMKSCGTCPDYEEDDRDTSYQHRWYSGECGKSRYGDAGSADSTYIVGGREARPGEYPWTAGLRYPPGLTGFHGCGGIIIAPRWVISVGHCVFAVPTYHWDVVVGDHDRTIVGEYKRSHEIETYYVHQRWGKDAWYDSDFALIRLKEPIEFNDYTQPACAPKPGKSYEGHTATVSGWGSDTQEWYNPTQILSSITT